MRKKYVKLQKQERAESASRTRAYERANEEKRALLIEKKIKEQLSRTSTHKNVIDIFDGKAQSAALFRLRADPKYEAAVSKLRACNVKSLSDWAPKGKGKDSLFRSLAEYLLAKYPMPKFLWEVFFNNDPLLLVNLKDVVVRLASGASLFDLCRDRVLAIPLTRKMCHDVMTSRGPTLLEAIRRAQVKAYGGDLRIAGWWVKWSGSRLLPDEVFWETVLMWLCRNPMLDSEKVGPLLDFINYRHMVETDFSMKGRSVLALLRGAEEWHLDLQKVKILKGQDFPQSLVAHPMDFDVSKSKEPLDIDIWRLTEILNSKELAEEGRELLHCVWSYAYSIQNRRTSIWSLKRETFEGVSREATIEVLNGERRIVQVRGKLNRLATKEQRNFVLQWASRNTLQVSALW